MNYLGGPNSQMKGVLGKCKKTGQSKDEIKISGGHRVTKHQGSRSRHIGSRERECKL